VGLIAELLKEFPVAAKYRSGLDAMEQENERLKAENADLKEELAHYIQQWNTLDGDAVKTLIYISQHECGHVHEIAQAYQINVQIVEMYLKTLVQADYVHAPLNGAEQHYGLALKGKRYLRERGLLKQRT
jgi:predicted transcriptional regulator